MRGTAASARSRQSGASSIQVLSYALAGWLVLVSALRLLPIYLEHRTVVAVLEQVVEEPRAHEDRSRRIRERLRKAWSLNGIDQVSVEDVRITRDRSTLTLSLKYSVPFPIFGGVSGVWAFDETLTSR